MPVELKTAQDVFAVTEGPGPVERLSKGQWAKAGTMPKITGLQPTGALVDVKSGNWLRDVGAAEGRNAVNSLYRNELSKQGKLFNKWSQNVPDELFNDLKSFPHRLALTALEANAAKNKTYGLRKYLELVVPYVNQHAGGIIGDAIKEEYFRAGRMKWQPLRPETIKNKKSRYAKFTGAGGRVPKPGIPLFGVTYTPSLPDGWQSYTYRWANWPHGIGGKFQGPMKAAKAGYKVPGATFHKNISTYMADPLSASGTSKVRSKSGFFAKPYKVQNPGKVKKGSVAYPPEMRGMALMDVVARLMPNAQVTYPYAGRGYKAALKAAAANPDTTRNAEMKIDGVIQPFYITPYVFYHDTGTSKMPKRSFISEGLSKGMGMVELVLHRYLEDAERNFSRAYRDTEIDEFDEFIDIEAAYLRGSTQLGDALVRSKVTGRAGLRKEPSITNFDLQFDNLIEKQRQMKGIIRRLFGNHMIWWFVPPSKYWHYVGLMSDIRGLFFGKKNFGAAKAYVSAMSIGIVGARAGTPVPFTPKARRRKFRKSLYTRAGYHRTTVGGHH